MADWMDCGCYWQREPGFGDVLHQCDAHKAGKAYPGSEPDPDVVEKIRKALGGRFVVRGWSDDD